MHEVKATKKKSGGLVAPGSLQNIIMDNAFHEKR